MKIKYIAVLIGLSANIFSANEPINQTDIYTPETLSQNGQEIQKTASGLSYKVIKKGLGKTAKADDEVKIRFKSYDSKGQVLDGTMSDTAVIMRPSDMFKGLKEGLMMMNAGSIYEFYISAHLGYSEDEGLGKKSATYRVEMIAINP